MTYLIELEQIFQKFIWNHERSHIATAILRKKNKVGEICCLKSNYTIKPQYTKQHGTVIKTDTQVNGTEYRAHE